MRAAILEGERNLVVADVPNPELAPGEVLVRVSYCGVCGSDVPRYLEGRVHSFPLILGHEFSGTVVEAGSGAPEDLVGRHVAGIPLIPCFGCPDCGAGDFSLCNSYSFIGSRRPGAFAELVAVPAANVYPVSDDVADLQAAFFEPAAVAQHAVNLVGVRPGAVAAVTGCGTIGILLAQMLQAAGVEVVGLARRRVRIEAAHSAGIERVCDTSREGWREGLLATLPRNGFDYIFDTSGNNAMMTESFELAANKGAICMVGTPKRPMEFDVRRWELLNRKELKVTGSWMSYSAPWPGCEWRQVEEGFATGQLSITNEMIDRIYDLEDASTAMERFAEPGGVNGKIVLRCNALAGEPGFESPDIRER